MFDSGKPLKVMFHSEKNPFLIRKIAEMINQFSVSSWKAYVYNLIGSEISSTSRYYDDVTHLLPLEHDQGDLLRTIKCRQKQCVSKLDEFQDWSQQKSKRTLVILNGNLNYSSNIQKLLSSVKPRLSRASRIVAVIYNPYFWWLYKIANAIGIRRAKLPENFVTITHLENICRLSGFELTRLRNVGYFPFRLLGLGTLINRILPTIPIFRWLGYACVVTLRPVVPELEKPSISILIPARDERKNIENALRDIPDLGGVEKEIIFVEGHSQDGTWEEIQRVIPLYEDRYRLLAFRQKGKGKNDAVRLGLKEATCDLVTILDADLTMPPENLELFYRSYCEGLGDFVNGNRLLYQMEVNAMNFLNRLGNIFFAKVLNYVLGISIGDALCGTKLFARHDYYRMVNWRKDFGDVDPFGDFDFLFSASELTLGVIDLPIRYAARTYGSTSISRFRDGLQLLKMSLRGFARIRLGKSPLSNGYQHTEPKKN
jgi:glycosyltransferase involved in cell wall biosynthesis